VTKLDNTHCASNDAQSIVRILKFRLGVEEIVYLCPIRDPEKWSMAVCKNDEKKLFVLAKRAVNRDAGESRKSGIPNFGIQVSDISHKDHLPK